MAQFPCSADGQRYAGPQQTLYPSFVDGSLRVGEKQRLCPRHFAERVERIQDFTPAYGEHVSYTRCWWGGCEADATVTLFATWYAAHAEREDGYARLCETHTRATAATLGVDVHGLHVA